MTQALLYILGAIPLVLGGVLAFVGWFFYLGWLQTVGLTVAVVGAIIWQLAVTVGTSG